MENETWRKSLSENMTALRKKHKLTQSELGEKLNYTDKSISKWERGDGVPDLSVLVKLSDLYKVSLDELLGRSIPDEVVPVQTAKHPILKQTSILMIMGGLLITLAFIVYFIISLVWPDFKYAWHTFVIALPCLFVSEGIWFLVWRKWPWAFGCMSIALWTLCVCLNVCIPSVRAVLIYVCGGIAQLIAIVVCGFNLLKKSL